MRLLRRRHSADQAATWSDLLERYRTATPRDAKLLAYRREARWCRQAKAIFETPTPVRFFKESCSRSHSGSGIGVPRPTPSKPVALAAPEPRPLSAAEQIDTYWRDADECAWRDQHGDDRQPWGFL